MFRGTRVPLQFLFDFLERGHTLQEFLEQYPTVSRKMAIAALKGYSGPRLVGPVGIR